MALINNKIGFLWFLERRNRRAGLVIFMGAFFLIPLPGFSQLPLLSDNAETLGRGLRQIELSNGLGYENEHRCIEQSREIVPVLTCGMLENWDLIVQCPFEFYRMEIDSMVRSVSGFSDMGLEVKYRVWDQGKFSVAIKPGIILPTGSYQRGLGGGKVGGSLFLITSADLALVLIHTNLAYLRNENFCGDNENIWHLSVAADISFRECFHGALNAGIERNPDPDDQNPPVFGMMGFYYLLSEDCELSAGYKCGITRPENDHAFIYGLTLRF